ncbi:MAG TPA: hypothetical protein ENN18_08895 [Proteobacteria bacterium]|nr:hypothetical protein [Pseudomonadota bacterium]
MPTIIGFVNQSRVEAEIGCNIELPIGFNNDGNQVNISDENGPINYRLLLLEDNGYEQIKIAGNNTSALLVQHNRNANNWNDQKAWLEENGWLPSRAGSFSHIKGESFFDEICSLLKGVNNKQAILQSMVARYEENHVLSILDTLAAYEILKGFGRTDFSEQCDLLWDWLAMNLAEELLGRINQHPPLSLDNFLAKADEIALELTTR